jgi:hypothetical protein
MHEAVADAAGLDNARISDEEGDPVASLPCVTLVAPQRGAWSLSGRVADGLADAVPLEGLGFSGESTPLYEIAPLAPRPASPPAEV